MSVEIGDPAPDFTLKDQHNGEVNLASFLGRQAVVLIFYPATFTGVCRGELAAVQEDLATLQNDEVQVMAVSVDSPFAHKVWAEQQGFAFPILADFWPHGAVASAYGAFNDVVGRAVRATFVIDREGIVRWKVVNAIPDAREHSEYAKALGEL